MRHNPHPGAVGGTLTPLEKALLARPGAARRRRQAARLENSAADNLDSNQSVPRGRITVEIVK